MYVYVYVCACLCVRVCWTERFCQYLLACTAHIIGILYNFFVSFRSPYSRIVDTLKSFSRRRIHAPPLRAEILRYTRYQK